MVDTSVIMEVLRTIPDPEMPVSIVDLGLIERIGIERADGGRTHVTVTVLPTFVGCPALDMIAQEIRGKIGSVEGVDRVVVEFIHDPPWSVDRITEEGRASLRAHGVTVPEKAEEVSSRRSVGRQQHAGEGIASREGPDGFQAARAWAPGDARTVALRTSAVPCPFCDSRQTRLESTFGPTRCRMIYYCDACRNGFEHMKKV